MKLGTGAENIEIAEPIEFEWDKWNVGKNQTKHGVAPDEAEEVFRDEGKLIFRDRFHSLKEKRFILVGKSQNDRVLYIVFTIRNKRVRVISARDLNRKERHLYP